MAVLLKRTAGVVRNECDYGCCTDVYGRHVKVVRRRIKRALNRRWKREEGL